MNNYLIQYRIGINPMQFQIIYAASADRARFQMEQIIHHMYPDQVSTIIQPTRLEDRR